MNIPLKLLRFFPVAKRYLSNGRLPTLLLAASVKAGSNKGRLSSVTDELQLLLRLGNAWFKGEYRAISAKALLSVVSTLIYFVSPLDVIPDWLLGAGFLDDIAVLGWLMSTWRAELHAFQHWLSEQEPENSLVARPLNPEEKSGLTFDQKMSSVE